MACKLESMLRCSLENITDEMDGPVKKISRLYFVKGMSDEEKSEARNLEINFKVSYKEAISIMVQELIARTNSKD